MLALDGRCKTLDASADGYVRGEACGALCIARFDGSGAVAFVQLQGSAVNQDGRSSALTAPNGPAQQQVISVPQKMLAWICVPLKVSSCMVQVLRLVIPLRLVPWIEYFLCEGKVHPVPLTRELPHCSWHARRLLVILNLQLVLRVSLWPSVRYNAMPLISLCI